MCSKKKPTAVHNFQLRFFLIYRISLQFLYYALFIRALTRSLLFFAYTYARFTHFNLFLHFAALDIIILLFSHH
jgi:hypothetical protein